jgi:Ser/Thr protein kinase RdoA (MazF antagonist)
VTANTVNEEQKQQMDAAFNLAKIALQSYELTDIRLRPLRVTSNKQIFLVSSPRRGNFLLRMYTSPQVVSSGSKKPQAILRSEAAVYSQMLWLRDIRRTMSLTVSEPVATKSGALVGRMDLGMASESLLFTLLRWVPGKQKKLGEFSSFEARYFGACIAKLHSHAEQYKEPEGFLRPCWDQDYVFGPSYPQWSLRKHFLSEREMKVLDVASERIKEELLAMGKSREVFGLIHRDLKPDNIIFHEGTLYVIDFDHCGWGYYLYDLAMPYLQMGRLGNRNRSTSLREALIEGYQSERTLPYCWQSQLQTFLAMRRMMVLHAVLRNSGEITLAGVAARTARKDSVAHKLVKSLEHFVHYDGYEPEV